MGQTENKIKELGIELPGPLPTAGDYVPVVVVEDRYAYTSGVLGVVDMSLAYPGRLGDDLDVEEGSQSARAACITALGALSHELGTLDRVERVVRVTGYVRAAPDFGQLPAVVDGASQLLGEVFGEAGRHVRSAVGVAALPFGGSVEVELIVQLRRE